MYANYNITQVSALNAYTHHDNIDKIYDDTIDTSNDNIDTSVTIVLFLIVFMSFVIFYLN